MNYSKDEIKQYVAEEDIKFIRLAFCDLSGRQKNISIHPDELDRAFTYGIAFDASAIPGFGAFRPVSASGYRYPLPAALAAGSRPGGPDVLRHHPP